MFPLTEDKKMTILKSLNVELGKDRKNIAVVKEKILQEQQELLENNPKLLEIKSRIEELELTLQQVDEIREKFETLKLKFQDQEKKISPVSSKIQDNVDKINHLEQATIYISCLKWIEDINETLKMKYDSPHGVELYRKICQLSELLESSQCAHLYSYIQQTRQFWFILLKEKYSPSFEANLQLIKWPFTSSNVSVTQQVPSHETLLKFKKSLRALLTIQYPFKVKSEIVTSSVCIDFKPPTLPIAILLKPLQKRFVFHFSGNKQTNRIDKPEWFLTLILTWVKDHQDFIDKHVQPIFDETGHGNAKTEFMRGLVQISVEKLLANMNKLVSDDLLFSHSVDEVLGFERELRDIYGYPQSEPSILQVFTQAPVLVMWIELEGKFARDKMDVMFGSETAWCESHSANGEVKVYECVDSFILLLTTMTERYEALPHFEHKAQFLDLQLNLLDDFRLRLMQVMHENEDLTPHILNTAHYLHYILNEWSTTLHFILLQKYKSSSGLGQTVFDDLLNLLDKMIIDLRTIILKSVFSQIKSKARRYCNENWFGKSIGSESNLSFTPSGCHMVRELSSQLFHLYQTLAPSLFTFMWENLATRVCNFLFDKLILANKFSKSGGKQLQFDVTRNLLLLFSQYTSNPERYFGRLLEACHLLSMDQVPKNPLQNIRFLSREDVFKVLRNRSDMNIRIGIEDTD